MGVGFVLGLVGVSGAAVIATALVLAWIFPETPGARFVPAHLPSSPVPALQTSPRADMARFYAEEMQQLNSAGWIDRTSGRVHMPIEAAMRKLAAEGIPGWPGPAQ